MMRCIAVDDEQLILDLIVDNIQKIPFLELSAQCKNALDAAAILHEEPIDLIFLDIHMPGLNGLQFVQSLKNPPMIIFITAYQEYALEGFELNAVDYLLKPVSFERFLKACNKAQELFNLQRKIPIEPRPDYFFVFVEYNQIKILIADIVYIEGMKDYVKIFLTTTLKPVITKKSLKELEEKLAAYNFARIHRSFIVSLDKITAIKRDLVCVGKNELPLSDNYKSAIEKLLS
jgi:DNA-binding LytR/AlgR family response regulator